MRFLLFMCLFVIPFKGSSQEFVPIEAESNIGKIILSENYINFEFKGIRRIELVHLSECISDLFSWQWVLESHEFHFEQNYEKLFLVEADRKTHNIVKYFRIYKYK